MRVVAYLVEDGEHILMAGVGEDDDGKGAQCRDWAGPANDTDGGSVWLDSVASAEVVDD